MGSECVRLGPSRKNIKVGVTGRHEDEAETLLARLRLQPRGFTASPRLCLGSVHSRSSRGSPRRPRDSRAPGPARGSGFLTTPREAAFQWEETTDRQEPAATAQH